MLLSLIIPQRPKLASTRDTVSSLGLIKRDVHVTESASVTNACHFRHALALDERRVKYIPEYFLEMNAHRSTGSPRSAISDVKEVWFAGSHSDVYVIPQSKARIDLMHSHPVVELNDRYMEHSSQTLRTMISGLTPFMLATYRLCGCNERPPTRVWYSSQRGLPGVQRTSNLAQGTQCRLDGKFSRYFLFVTKCRSVVRVNISGGNVTVVGSICSLIDGHLQESLVSSSPGRSTTTGSYLCLRRQWIHSPSYSDARSRYSDCFSDGPRRIVDD